jgi:hypothetical protein
MSMIEKGISGEKRWINQSMDQTNKKRQDYKYVLGENKKIYIALK